MKLQFDPNQTFQLDAVAAVTDLFDGQPQGTPEYAVINLGEMGGLFAGQDQTELGVGNRLLVAEDKLRKNLRAVQTRNDIEVVDLAAAPEAAKVVDGEEMPIGRKAAESICAALVGQKMLDVEGRIQPAFDPKRKDFRLDLPEAHRELLPSVIDLLSSYQIERHIRRERDDGPNKLRKEVTLSPEFVALWDRIKPKTTYRVEFETDALVRRVVDAIKRMEKIDAAARIAN